MTLVQVSPDMRLRSRIIRRTHRPSPRIECAGCGRALRLDEKVVAVGPGRTWITRLAHEPQLITDEDVVLLHGYCVCPDAAETA